MGKGIMGKEKLPFPMIVCLGDIIPELLVVILLLAGGGDLGVKSTRKKAEQR